ncbi:PREDICTED: COX assembly mitochondrial protein homolog [Cercocebus atys]|uniref:COX assembly mitochondrial protein homolog n=1 Tax=Cercocebus atys TaxID=9531 RepID=UPI0005F45FAB|nr:PREDICTED: COX assembly mitochondrial protein homolog [Cercocebus atys]
MGNEDSSAKPESVVDMGSLPQPIPHLIAHKPEASSHRTRIDRQVTLFIVLTRTGAVPKSCRSGSSHCRPGSTSGAQASRSEAARVLHGPAPKERSHAPFSGHSLCEVSSTLVTGLGRGRQSAGATGGGSRNLGRKRERGLAVLCQGPTFLLWEAPGGRTCVRAQAPLLHSPPRLPRSRQTAGFFSARRDGARPRRVNGSTKLSSRTNQHLRHVEKDILIPKIMREKAKERCSEQVQDFTKCCKNSGVLMVVKCRKENSALKECLTAYYNDPAFHEECKMEYLKEREEFRKTGIPAKERLQKVPTSM